MKKELKALLIVILILFIGFIIYMLYSNNSSNNNIEEKTQTKYYTYEGNGKFVMSSTSNKVDNYNNLNNNYFIKEEIKNEISKEKIIEVLFSESPNEKYYLYGNYKESDFNNYFKDKIDNGLKCDNKTVIGLGEGNSIKCIEHESNYKYDNISSELCVNINNKLLCIKPNDWNNNNNYKKSFEENGLICEYHNYNTGKYSSNDVPTNGTLECSKEKPSIRKNSSNELMCYINTEGYANCGDNNGWCGMNTDLNTWCFGVN